MKCKYKDLTKEKKWEWYTGEFIQWGVDFEEFAEGAGNYTAAVVKKTDGTIKMVYAENVKFETKKSEEPFQNKPCPVCGADDSNNFCLVCHKKENHC